MPKKHKIRNNVKFTLAIKLRLVIFAPATRKIP